jgi:hypothetical protein
VSGPLRRVLVNGEPTDVHLDDTHLYGGGELLTGAARPPAVSVDDAAVSAACGYCAGNVTWGPPGECCPLCGMPFTDAPPAAGVES